MWLTGLQWYGVTNITFGDFSAAAIVAMLAHVYGIQRQSLTYAGEYELYALAEEYDLRTLINTILDTLEHGMIRNINNPDRFANQLYEIYSRDEWLYDGVRAMASEVCSTNLSVLMWQQEFQDQLSEWEALRADVAQMLLVANGGEAFFTLIGW